MKSLWISIPGPHVSIRTWKVAWILIAILLKSYLRRRWKSVGKNILIAEKTQFPELSNLRLDQRAIFTVESSGTSVSFTFSPGYDIHFGGDSYKSEFAKAEILVKSFVRFHYNSFYESQIKTIQDKMKTLQSDIDSNSKKTDKNNKSITDNKSDGETDKTKVKEREDDCAKMSSILPSLHQRERR